jgi:hypothetical protein
MLFPDFLSIYGENWLHEYLEVIFLISFASIFVQIFPTVHVLRQSYSEFFLIPVTT